MLVLAALRVPKMLFSKAMPSTIPSGGKARVCHNQSPASASGDHPWEALFTKMFAGVITVADGSAKQSELCGSTQQNLKSLELSLSENYRGKREEGADGCLII